MRERLAKARLVVTRFSSLGVLLHAVMKMEEGAYSCAVSNVSGLATKRTIGAI